MVIKSIKTLHEYINMNPLNYCCCRQLGILKMPAEDKDTVITGRALVTALCFILT